MSKKYDKKIVEDTGSCYRLKGDDFWYVRNIGPGPDIPLINIGPGPNPDPRIIGPGCYIDDLRDEEEFKKNLEALAKELKEQLKQKKQD